jgi:hypothetical protein
MRDDDWVRFRFDLNWPAEDERASVGLDFPRWVPESVVQMAISLWKIDAERRSSSCMHENTEYQQAIFRLSCDPRMRQVWVELRKKHHHVDAQAAWPHWLRMLGETASLVDRTSDEIGLALFFHRAAFLAIGDIARRAAAMKPSPSRADLHRLRADYEDMVDGRVPERWAPILEATSRFFDDFDLQTSIPVVQRDRRNRRVRIFANLLANVTKQLFGQIMNTTVATTTNVALDLRGSSKFRVKTSKIGDLATGVIRIKNRFL